MPKRSEPITREGGGFFNIGKPCQDMLFGKKTGDRDRVPGMPCSAFQALIIQFQLILLKKF
jgi:hypothetical protein